MEAMAPPRTLRAVRASRDRQRLRESIWEQMTETLSAPRSPRRRPANRTPYAVHLWIGHLALLEQILEIAPMPWSELRAEEAEGLLLLRAARDRFRQEFRPCSSCGAAIRGKICPRCGNLN